MSETLGPAEMDALLETLSGKKEGADVAPTLDRKEAGSYDFSHPDLLSRDQVRSLRTLHEGYAQALAKRLSTEFLANVSASVVAVDHLTYGEFLALVQTPTVLSVIEVPQLDGNVAIELAPNVAFAFIDRLLGGAGKPVGKVRALTAIEQGLMERVFRRCCDELSMIWGPILSVDFAFQSIESNPELARVVGPNEMAVLVSLELEMEAVSGTMNLCLPYVVMEPAIKRLGQGTTFSRSAGRSSGRTKQALESSVRTSTLRVDVDLGHVELSLAEILDLEVGDVLRVTPACEDGACARIEDRSRLRGRPGRHRGNLALLVTEVDSLGTREGEHDAGA